MLRHALWYANRGIPVFPLKPGLKIPATRHGVKDACTNPHAVAALFRDGTVPYNVGLACGHAFDVIDVDLPGWDVRENPDFDGPDVYGIVRTPRGGCHLYVPADPQARNAVGMLPGIDYRARGGYVVAPPSTSDLGAWAWERPPVFDA